MNNIDCNPTYLVHYEGNKQANLVVKFENNQLVFMEARLNKIMKSIGISLPTDKRPDFRGKRKVYLVDDRHLFDKTFKEIYFHLHMPKNEYK